MSTFLFHDCIYGPVHSRRLGNSLGINLLPTEKKYCNFNCIYCECGANTPGKTGRLPEASFVADSLAECLRVSKNNGVKINSITFAGNGEPTLHPKFSEILKAVKEARDLYCPEAKISVLSNATRISDDAIVEALKNADNRILKLDSAVDGTVKAIDRPAGNYSVEKTVELLKRFGGKFILQTMFLSGEVDGKQICNLTDTEINAWLEVVKELRPEQVMIYTIARDTPEKNLQKASHEDLEKIRRKVEALGVKISVSE